MPPKDTLKPTFVGYMGSTKDALLIIQATLNQQLLLVPRRPHDKERAALIKSGNIFVFIEERSGIKRWTDGILWSPSRILGRFLVYRELDRLVLSEAGPGTGTGPNQQIPGYDDSFAGQNKRKRRKKSVPGGHVTSHVTDTNPDHVMSASAPASVSAASGAPQHPSHTSTSLTNRALVGSLVASYLFKDSGLIKKTLSVTIQNQHHKSHPAMATPATETIHLVGYYSAEDVLNATLRRPSDVAELKELHISVALYNLLRESNLGSKNSAEEENFYFFDANNQLVLLLELYSGQQQLQQRYATAAPLVVPQPPVPQPQRQLSQPLVPPQQFWPQQQQLQYSGMAVPLGALYPTQQQQYLYFASQMPKQLAAQPQHTPQHQTAQPQQPQPPTDKRLSPPPDFYQSYPNQYLYYPNKYFQPQSGEFFGTPQQQPQVQPHQSQPQQQQQQPPHYQNGVVYQYNGAFQQSYPFASQGVVAPQQQQVPQAGANGGQPQHYVAQFGAAGGAAATQPQDMQLQFAELPLLSPLESVRRSTAVMDPTQGGGNALSRVFGYEV